MNDYFNFWNETEEIFYHNFLWLLNNNYSLQMYFHAATIAFM